MARDLIHFVPDRLNAEPVAYRGFTTPELAAATGLSLLAGLVIGIVPGLVWTWVIIPTCALFMPFVTILLGGACLYASNADGRITGCGRWPTGDSRRRD